jgi:hypothetical protein
MVAALLASELGRDNDWQQQQILLFEELAKGYLPDPEKSLNAIP